MQYQDWWIKPNFDEEKKPCWTKADNFPTLGFFAFFEN